MPLDPLSFVSRGRFAGRYKETTGISCPEIVHLRQFEGSLALNKRKVLDAARKHAQKGAKAKALKEYNQLLKADPRDAKLLLEVGDAYRRWGQPEEAIAQYSKVAGQYRQDGFDARAVAVYKQILNLDPKHYAAYVSLAELYQRMGLDSEAVASLQIAADGYHKDGRKPEALDLLRQMAALDPANTTSRLKVAELLRQEGMNDDAITEYREVVAELQNQQDLDQLIVVQDRILEISPKNLETLTAQVRNLMSAGALDRAEPLAAQALNISEEPAQYDLLIDLYAQMGNDEKLANATRGLAKIYRERGDEDKARELMQRLPAEDVVAPEASLAVDLAGTEAPVLDDEELLDEPFLANDDEFDMLGTSSSSSVSSSMSGAQEKAEELSLDEIVLDSSMIDSAGESGTEPLPLPEGDPDQLLAEANVYLRYGKREQAIASLRSVIAQVPDHRGALEKLGEAYAEGGRNSDAVTAWLKAAEQVRLEGDGAALEVLRDRIAALDPGLAEQVGTVESQSASTDEASAEAAGDAGDAGFFGVELDLDVEVDLDLDDAIDEIAASEAEPDLVFDSPDATFDSSLADLSIDAGVEDANDEFEIDLDEDSLVFGDGSGADSQTSLTQPAVDDDGDVFDLSEELAFEKGDEDGLDEFVDDDDDDVFEFEIDTSGLSADALIDDSELDSSDSGNDVGTDLETSAPDEQDDSGQVASSSDEEIEEAEFYVAQDMFEEAEAILSRVLEAEPSHTQALVLMGELASVRTDTEASGSASPPNDLATALIESDVDTSLSGGEGDASLYADEGDATLSRVDVISDADDQDDFDVELDMDISDLSEETEKTADEVGPSVEVAVEAAEESAEAEEKTTPEGSAPGVDAGESFDLREALADVIGDDGSGPAPDASGVLSTVEDGFESIFSDFKKGVTATLEDGDFDTRYDLGIAYREMGLFDDAIGEFRVCLDCPTRRFDSLYLMGLCARDLSRWEDAVNHLKQALASPEIPEERLAGVYFDLSIVEEGSGDPTSALASVQRVIELEPEFPGASERLAALEAGESAFPDVGTPGEAFESFDDLFDDEESYEAGGVALAEDAPAEAFESFDDVISEAESALDETQVEEVEEETTASRIEPKKGGRKKISFV
jgi:tetratricopeptide (TPR) repeat protein